MNTTEEVGKLVERLTALSSQLRRGWINITAEGNEAFSAEEIAQAASTLKALEAERDELRVENGVIRDDNAFAWKTANKHLSENATLTARIKGLEEGLRAIANLPDHSREDALDNMDTMARLAASLLKGGGSSDANAHQHLSSATEEASGKDGEATRTLSAAARDIPAERARQVRVEGWTTDHDDEHDGGQLGSAAACYAMPYDGQSFTRLWPWDAKWWKPKDRRSDLVRAGALVVAEIERLDRSAGK